MARGIQCTAISAVTGLGRIGVGMAKFSLDLAFLPVAIASQGLGALKAEGEKMADRADQSLKNIGTKCGL